VGKAEGAGSFRNTRNVVCHCGNLSRSQYSPASGLKRSAAPVIVLLPRHSLRRGDHLSCTSYFALPGLSGPTSQEANPNSVVWFCIILASFLEPIFQLGWGFSVYVGLYVFAFNLLELYVFRRYDFVSMYSFRLVYYIHWHIVWGYVRLQLLF